MSCGFGCGGGGGCPAKAGGGHPVRAIATHNVPKSLDRKLANIHADPSGAKDFILADAKDADMATGLAATGKDPVTGKARTLAEYREQMRQIIKQGLVDIVLMS